MATQNIPKIKEIENESPTTETAWKEESALAETEPRTQPEEHVPEGHMSANDGSIISVLETPSTAETGAGSTHSTAGKGSGQDQPDNTSSTDIFDGAGQDKLTVENGFLATKKHRTVSLDTVSEVEEEVDSVNTKLFCSATASPEEQKGLSMVCSLWH